MSLLTITTPEVETKIRVQNPEGDVLFEDDVIIIDHLLSLAQREVNMDDEDSISKWLPIFTSRINSHYKVDLGSTTAFYIAKEASSLMWELKKNYDSTLTLQESTE